MSSHFLRVALGLSLVFCTFQHTFAQSVSAAREVPARWLPVSETVSPQMQALIARPFDPKFNLGGT